MAKFNAEAAEIRRGPQRFIDFQHYKGV